jgi:hypothetical protein
LPHPIRSTPRNPHRSGNFSARRRRGSKCAAPLGGSKCAASLDSPSTATRRLPQRRLLLQPQTLPPLTPSAAALLPPAPSTPSCSAYHGRWTGMDSISSPRSPLPTTRGRPLRAAPPCMPELRDLTSTPRWWTGFPILVIMEPSSSTTNTEQLKKRVFEK